MARSNRGVSGTEPAMELAILALLEQHGSLAYEQVTAHLGEPPNAARSALQAMRERVWVPSTPSKTCHPSLARGRCLDRALRAINLVGASVFAGVHLRVRVCIYEFHGRARIPDWAEFGKGG